ncbi:DNA-binding protein REB1 [Wickerhamiella sorbophila]|uniref:DNA-binding protein REB1 n=1 Tax=Wickerhamiella sorbophila TaxID=45607 RepID=A0A2T0FMY1_9ASCO|nr:DNA-binding protein REB1 [Wickerhamiella sorbophila]PRT56344.1 DNA-binding protein REB1 [Wickerhamiella sorbophila]
MADKVPQNWDTQTKAAPNLQIADYIKEVPEKPLVTSKDTRNGNKAEPIARALLSLGADTPARVTGTSQRPEEGTAGAGPGAGSFFGVEEAVMRYVGGTLQDDRSQKKRKANASTTTGQYEADFNEYIGNGSWEKFLREDITGGEAEPHEAHTEAYAAIFDSTAAGHVPAQGPMATGSSSRTEIRPPNELRSKKRRLGGVSVENTLPHISGADVRQHGLDQPLFESSSSGLGLSSEHPDDDKAKLDGKNRIAWTGDGSETGGSFDDAECRALDEFLERFMIQNSMTRQQLCERVWTAERKKDNFWDAVSAVLPHRTRASVYKHVRRVYHVFTVRGKWSPAEDLHLGQLVNERGAQWKSISLTMHRMPEDCRDRWRNYVKCGGQRNQNKWSVKEESQLHRVVTEQMAQNPGAPVNWTIVSEQMGCTRSRIQCRYKWKKLVRKTLPG